MFTYENSQIEIVNRYKYLGVLLDDHLDFSTTAELLAGAAGRALGAVLTKFKNFRNIGFNTFRKLFDTSVSPILGYAFEVWGYKDNVLGERVHQRASRYYLSVHPKTPLLALTGDMGWKTAQMNRHIRMVRYWNRLLTLDDDRLTKKVFWYDKELCTNNWSSEMKALFNATKMGWIYDNMDQCNVSVFENKCMENLTERCVLGLSLKPKLRTYLLF